MAIDETDDIESYSVPSLCLEKAKELLAIINLPTGLLPLKDMTEVGYKEQRGFIHSAIGRKVTYDTEITAFELMIWVPVNDIFIKERDPEKITFTNTTGLSRTFKVSAFQIEG
ncbi:hypothetical protein Bca52824_032601 [Brassica carinata]|uniref:Uncharacterized protein n=1 Tax=Brassica carinata TaxID=52824 RepID=A0A8X7SCB8_BRACI|nr:hypothetical protein Bca52824_032601 [Brassica carinata]